MTEADKVPLLLEKAKSIITGELLLPTKNVGRVVFVGDTHTATDVTEKVFDIYLSDSDLIVFLGDYVDRGNTGTENIGMILSKMLENPNKVVMLRGDHESPLTNFHYGFVEETIQKFGDNGYEQFKEFFKTLPYAVSVNGYLCVHGGIPMGLQKVEDIANLPGGDINPDDPVAFQLLWNDPRDMIEGFLPSVRGEGAYYYGRDVTRTFLSDNGLEGIIRGHEVTDGIREDMDGKVITVFSSRYHGGLAGVLVMNDGKTERVMI